MRKVGHAGTLDPFATGLMVVAVGKATRLLSYFLAGEKTYVATLQLGQESDTRDTEGVLTDVSPRVPTSQEIVEVLASFEGKQMQTPPSHSALKVDGKRAYELARAGKDVQLADREVMIHDISLLSYEYPKVVFSAHVSTGTYIRSLGHDIGKKLGVGGYLVGLERTKVGILDLKDALTMEQVKDTALANVSLQNTGSMPYSFPLVEAEEEMRYDICHGIPVPIDIGDMEEGERLGILLGNELVAVGEVKDKMAWPRKVFIV